MEAILKALILEFEKSVPEGMVELARALLDADAFAVGRTEPSGVQFSDFSRLYGLRTGYSSRGDVWSNEVELAIKGAEKVAVGVFACRCIGRNKEVGRLRLLEMDLWFVRWNQDLTRVFEGDSVIGTVDRAWQKRVRVTSFDGWSCSVEYPTWPWQKARCRWGQVEVRFPPRWPECGEWGMKESELVCGLPKDKRELLVGVLIWKNTLDNVSLWQPW